MTPIKVAVIDDHTLFREGVANLLREEPELDVVFTAENGKALQEKLQTAALPDVVLMDINMPVLDGFAATAWLRKQHPGIRVLALSMYEDDDNIIRMLRQGAGGYMLKESRKGDLVQGIRAIHQQGFFVNDMVSGRLLHQLHETGTQAAAPQVRISEREQQFLRLCCSELTYKEIADRMGVSPRTVDNYREDLFEKLGLKSRVGLVLYALKYKLAEIG
ncbi:MAG: response regulator transcription factor [Chitinophagaceae bacterium]|nr:MAG: response regulator transcription factor [Chitinophagaceae bacterium]